MLCSILNWLMISWYCQYTLCIGVGFNCNQMFYPIFENSMIKHNLNGPLVLLIVDVQTSFFFLPRCQIFCHCYIFQIYKTKISLTKYQNAILILYCTYLFLRKKGDDKTKLYSYLLLHSKQYMKTLVSQEIPIHRAEVFFFKWNLKQNQTFYHLPASILHCSLIRFLWSWTIWFTLFLPSPNFSFFSELSKD